MPVSSPRGLLPPHGFIDAFAARLQATPPMPTYSFTDQHIMRFSAILIMALGTVQGGRDTSLAAEAAFQQLPPRLPRTFVPTSTLAAPPSPCPPPAPCSATHSRSSLLDDRGPPVIDEQHSHADQRGPRSRSQHDRSPAQSDPGPAVLVRHRLPRRRRHALPVRLRATQEDQRVRGGGNLRERV